MVNKVTNFRLSKSRFIHSTLGLFIVLAIIANSGYVWFMTESSKPVLFLIPLTALLMIIQLMKGKSIKFKRTNSILFFFIFLILATFFINREFSSVNLYINLVLLIFSSFLLTLVVPFESFIDVFIKVMKYITLVSLFFYSIFNFFGVGIPFEIIYTKFTSYYNGIIYFQFTNSPDKNLGVFWEPGLFASFLVIALALLIVFKGIKGNYVTLIILATGLISTKSTAGYLMIPLLLILSIQDKMKKNVELFFVYLLLLIVMLIFLFPNQIINTLIQINPSIFGKLISDSATLETRLLSPILNLRIFLSSPIFGVGFSNATRIFIQNSLLFKVDSQTSTSTFYLSALGIGGLIYTLIWILGISRLKTSRINRVILLFIILIIINKEPHSFILVTYGIMFYFLNIKMEFKDELMRI